MMVKKKREKKTCKIEKDMGNKKSIKEAEKVERNIIIVMTMKRRQRERKK